jgi:hypothetical protein
MSVSYAARFCVGVKLSKVFEVRTETEAVTKFNEDTGQPYTTTKSKRVVYFCGKPSKLDEMPLEWESSKEVLNLDVIYPDSEGDRDDWILGKEIAVARNEGYRDSKPVVEIDPKVVSEAMLEVTEKLQKLGGDDFKVPEIGIFLVSYVSY